MTEGRPVPSASPAMDPQPSSSPQEHEGELGISTLQEGARPAHIRALIAQLPWTGTEAPPRCAKPRGKVCFPGRWAAGWAGCRRQEWAEARLPPRSALPQEVKAPFVVRSARGHCCWGWGGTVKPTDNLSYLTQGLHLRGLPAQVEQVFGTTLWEPRPASTQGGFSRTPVPAGCPRWLQTDRLPQQQPSELAAGEVPELQLCLAGETRASESSQAVLLLLALSWLPKLSWGVLNSATEQGWPRLSSFH